jgi:hypothetical protein
MHRARDLYYTQWSVWILHLSLALAYRALRARGYAHSGNAVMITRWIRG